MNHKTYKPSLETNTGERTGNAHALGGKPANGVSAGPTARLTSTPPGTDMGINTIGREKAGYPLGHSDIKEKRILT